MKFEALLAVGALVAACAGGVPERDAAVNTEERPMTAATSASLAGEWTLSLADGRRCGLTLIAEDGLARAGAVARPMLQARQHDGCDGGVRVGGWRLNGDRIELTDAQSSTIATLSAASATVWRDAALNVSITRR